AAMPFETSHFGVLSCICLFLFIGATGKSAQIPLYVWLPDAMEGPTPVSALIHAATMVTAGVYMVGRNAVLFSHAPQVMMIIAIVGVLTAFMAASMLVGMLAIAGIAPFAGFFSKDEILFRAFLANKPIWVIAVATALMTAFYMGRLIYMTFFGPYHGPAWETAGHAALAAPAPSR